jgi:hypothetical protein
MQRRSRLTNAAKQVAIALERIGVYSSVSETRFGADKSSLGNAGNMTQDNISVRRDGADPPKSASGMYRSTFNEIRERDFSAGNGFPITAATFSTSKSA